MSNYKIYIAFVCFLTLSVHGQMTSADFLKADGTVLRNNNGLGDTITLRGTNLGAWLSMEYWMGPVGKGSLNRSTWQASASSSYPGTDLQNVFDRDLNSRWSSGLAQIPDGSQYFMVDMQENVLFNRVSFEAGSHTGDYPRGYKIEVSEDANNWEEVMSGTGSTENIFVQLPNIYFKRYIKITQTGTANSNFWSIAEFNLYMEDDFTVRNSLIDRFGEDGADVVLDSFQKAWITTNDLDNIKAMGMNMVRVPFYWMEIMYNDGTIKPQGFDQLDWVIAECNSRNMYVILDLHGAPGGMNGFITSGQAFFNELWTNSTYQQMTIDIWKALAHRYKDNPTVAAYDLLNEPLSSDQTNYPIHGFYNTLYKEVRSIDPDHIISIGAFPGFNFVVPPAYYGWTNVLYQVHHYNEDKTNWASQNGFIDAILLDVANHMYNWNVPVLAGEFNFWDFPDLWERYLSGLNKLNVSWSNWAYKVKRIDNPVENWGYYDGFDGPIPDIHYDSPEVISEKWSQYITPNFRINQGHIDNVKQFTTTQVTLPPFGETIWIKGNNLKYLTILDDNETLSCDKIKVDNQVKFEVVDAGNGEIALLGANNMYVSAGNGVNNMLCNAVNIGDTETFKFIQLEDGRIALRSKQGYYVSSEDGQKPVIANRQSIDGWEVFSWGTNFSNGKPKNVTAKIYPNPAKDEVIIKSNLKNYNLKVFNMFSQLVKETKGVEGEMNFSTSDLRPGLYVFFINDEKTDPVVRKIIIH